MTVFDKAFAVVIGEEGGYTASPEDPGNWTGGRCNSGLCNGTKYGISAAAYPTLLIRDLSIDEARTIYRRDYWNHVCGDDLPAALALLVFDAAVNSGPGRAVRWLQMAVRVIVDGRLGPVTMAAVRNCSGSGATVLTEYQAQRLLFLTTLPTWRTFGQGWARRVMKLQYEALRIGEGA